MMSAIELPVWGLVLVLSLAALAGCVGEEDGLTSAGSQDGAPADRDDDGSSGGEPDAGGEDGERVGTNESGNQTVVVENETSAPYKAGLTMGASTSCNTLDGNPGNLGGVCLRLPDQTRSVEVSVEDDVSPHVGFSVYYWNNSNDDYYEPQLHVCDEVTVSPPSGAAWLSVEVDGPAFGNMGCAGEGPHAPTTGTVSATITHVVESRSEG